MGLGVAGLLGQPGAGGMVVCVRVVDEKGRLKNERHEGVRRRDRLGRPLHEYQQVA